MTKVEYIIQELIDKEKSYISLLEQGIEDYVSKFDELEESSNLPNSLKNQRKNIFANIESIHYFHKTKFYPKLVECGFNPEKVAELLISLINDNHFDKYIIFVMSREKSEKICKEYKYFFKQLQKDRLGINSFLLNPIQKIPRYRLMVNEMKNELLKDLDKNKTAIACSCIAEKKIQKLLTEINEYCE